MEQTDETTDIGRRLAKAIAERDRGAVLAELAPDVWMRFLIPSGPSEVHGADAAAATFLQWFGHTDVLRTLDVSVAPVADRTSLRYRFELHESDGWSVAEQQLYLDVDADGLIFGIDLMCSGFRPIGDPDAYRTSPGPVEHRFDAGGLGCADGLAQEFRRRIQGIPVGDVLVVQARDPAAKEDLPPLARMMGHAVHSVEPADGGGLLITVERGR
jgi:TusA-related sulfurtransferase